MTCPKCQEMIGSMSMHYCPLIAEMPAKEKADDRLHPTAGSEPCCETCCHYLKIHPDGYPGGMCSQDRERLSCWPTDSCLDWESAQNA
jgi:hypothetical protein